LRKATISFAMSACPSVRPSAWNNSAPTGQFLIKYDVTVFFRITMEKIQVLFKSDKTATCDVNTRCSN